MTFTDNIKGCCFYATDFPEPNYPHIIVVISGVKSDGKVLFVPISSIKFVSGGKYEYKGVPCKYYDDSCIFTGNEIVREDGRPILNKPSFARYQWANEIRPADIIKKQLDKIYKYRCIVNSDVLKSLQNGAKISDNLEPIFQKYFDFF
jgi:hypothetical protein